MSHKVPEIYHYSATAECFPDVVKAFSILLETHLGKFKVIAPNIHGFLTGEVDVDFWTTSTITELQKVWTGEGVEKLASTLKEEKKPWEDVEAESKLVLGK